LNRFRRTQKSLFTGLGTPQQLLSKQWINPQIEFFRGIGCSICQQAQWIVQGSSETLQCLCYDAVLA